MLIVFVASRFEFAELYRFLFRKIDKTFDDSSPKLRIAFCILGSFQCSPLQSRQFVVGELIAFDI